MGCVADKPMTETRFPPASTKYGFAPASSLTSLSFAPQEQNSLLSSKIAEAIKKKDIILFQKAIQQYQVKPNDVVGPTHQLKTVLHKLAEHNFSQGMNILLKELSAQHYPQLNKVINMRDADGNTPLLLCCLFNAVETLEVLLKSEHVDIEAKNFAKKTALEVAVEMESPCVNVLNSVTSGITTKASLKSANGEGSQQIRSLEEAEKKFNVDKDLQLSSLGFDTKTSLHNSQNNIDEAKEMKKIMQDVHGSDKLLYHILMDLKINDKNFKDVEFPHEFYYLEAENRQGELSRRYPYFRWSRPNQFMGYFKNSYTVFDEFLCNLTTQTPLAGCEVYSAFAALAEFPHRLVEVFNTRESSSYGIYSVNFTVAGSIVEILLDDYLPSVDGSQLLYSKPINGELWFSFLEKAFAKLHGGYAGLENITLVDALETLTGMPVAQKSIKDVDEETLWGKLLDYDKKNYIVCAGEVRRYHSANRNRNFSVVGVTEINDVKLVKLRNHFESSNWQGDYSRFSNKWTPELIEKLGFNDADTSCFYMQLKDFIKEFDSLTVCHYHDNWNRNTIEADCAPNHPVYFELEVDKETETYISVHQKAPKFVNEGPAYDISPVEIIMAKDLDGAGFESIAVGERDAFVGKPIVYVHDTHRVKLQPGKYVIYLKVRWTDGTRHGAALNVFSSNPAKVGLVNPKNYSNFLERLYLNSGLTAKQKFTVGGDCLFSSGWAGTHLWVCGENKGKKIWTLEVNFLKMKNIRLGKKGRVSRSTLKLVLLPGQKVAAFAKRVGPAAVNFGWELKHTFN